ncbi:alpha-L-fucosidase [Microbacterium sp. gxy059]|uniref:alpha-L-fucosidase n=1 Tax=Microbacterium sp. gxy059 TaxID=2957199 RepID=UPI003D968264
MDAEAWVRELADAGFRRVIYTAKHHDGFVTWQSRYTDFGVMSAPWEDGQGDVLREVADTARKYGLDLGVYLSPSDSHQEIHGVFGNGSEPTERTIPTLVEGDDREGRDLPTFSYEATDYGASFLNLLYEVLTEYGPITEVWFDGAQGHTGKTENYDFPAFYEMIHKLQPDALVAIEGHDVRWVGNEEGTARADEWSPIPTTPKSTGALDFAYASPSLGSDAQATEAVQQGDATELRWFPAEADFKLTQGWFAHPGDTPKSAEQLMDLHTRNVGRNAVFLMNVPPTTDGSYAPASSESLAQFGSALAEAYTTDVALGRAAVVAGEADDVSTRALTDGDETTSAASADGVFVVELDEPQRIDRVKISEDTLAHGQQATSFAIEARTDGEWVEIESGSAIGASRIAAPSDPVTADALRVVTSSTRGTVHLASIRAWQQTADAPVKRSGPVHIDCSAETAGTGTEDSPYSSIEQLRFATLDAGAEVRFRSGADCAGTTGPTSRARARPPRCASSTRRAGRSRDSRSRTRGRPTATAARCPSS